MPAGLIPGSAEQTPHRRVIGRFEKPAPISSTVAPHDEAARRLLWAARMNIVGHTTAPAWAEGAAAWGGRRPAGCPIEGTHRQPREQSAPSISEGPGRHCDDPRWRRAGRAWAASPTGRASGAPRLAILGDRDGAIFPSSRPPRGPPRARPQAPEKEKTRHRRGRPDVRPRRKRREKGEKKCLLALAGLF